MTGFGFNVSGFGSFPNRGPSVPFIEATGGTVTTSGDYKIHTFTSSGTFQVTEVGDVGVVEVLLIAGGGGTGATSSADGGAGGGGCVSGVSL